MIKFLTINILFCTLFLTGCNKTKNSKLRIAVIPKGTTHEFWKMGEAGAKKAGNELGIDIIWKGPQKESDRAGQIKVVENFITQGVDGIALAPLDDKALVRSVTEAKNAGIKVAVWDSGLDESAGDAVISSVMTNNFAAGQDCGKRLAMLMNGSGKVLMLRHAVNHDSTTKREEGFLDGIKKTAPGIELLSIDQRGGVSIDEAMKVSESLLNQFGDQVDGVFTPNESTTQGMLRALDQAGLAGKFPFVGFDTNEALLQGLKDKKVSALAVQDPFQMGYTAVRNIFNSIQQKPFEANVDTGAVLLDLENIDTEEVQKIINPQGT
ncbi:MAG: substrate-binding domain-containing protein [Verrucomicrobiales bacterium]|nr:substrate-binding domain-containing protein [Verrucomicrobiales bacterium]